MKMRQGEAFAMGGSGSNSAQNRQSRLTPAATATYKRWLHLNGRKFLLEELPVRRIAAELNTLPPANSAVSLDSKLKIKSSRLASALPLQRLPLQCTNQIQIASIDFNKQSGVVLDYVEVNMDTNAFTFQTNATYYVDGSYNLAGTTIIKDGRRH